ncbi:MAG: hypothetical protein KKB37_02680 [Alphaproteobacteria bacterium]|nr:hypothetical protein [Alphaproteobacteria bacterium]
MADTDRSGDVLRDPVRNTAKDPAASEATMREQLDALRDEIAALSSAARTYAEQAGSSVSRTARSGVGGMKKSIGRNPSASMLLAAGLGASLALLVPRRSLRRPSAHRLSSDHVPRLTNYNYDLTGLTHAVERAIERAAPRERYVAAGNRISETVADSQANIAAVAERLMAWWDEAKRRAAKKAGV